MPADGQGLQRHRDRPRPANLDDAIDTAVAGELTRFLVPIRRLGVVDNFRRAHRLEPLGLVSGRGRRDHPGAIPETVAASCRSLVSNTRSSSAQRAALTRSGSPPAAMT